MSQTIHNVYLLFAVLVNNSNHWNQSNKYISVADPGFSTGGGTNPRGAKLLFWPIFSPKKLHRNDEFWPSGSRPWRPFLRSPNTFTFPGSKNSSVHENSFAAKQFLCCWIFAKTKMTNKNDTTSFTRGIDLITLISLIYHAEQQWW